MVNLGSNHLLELHYIEDITKSNIIIAATINDTETALVSKLFGLEAVSIEFKDHKENTISTNMVIYDIKDRMIVSGKKMKATLYMISPDAVNNSATKISERFGKGGGETSSEIVKDLVSPLVDSSSLRRELLLTNHQQRFHSFLHTGIRLLSFLG